MKDQETRTVTIPACAQHEGILRMTVTIPWNCLVCGEKRGEPFQLLSWDGSRRMLVNGWRNPCGHNETYKDIRDYVNDKRRMAVAQ